MQAAILERLNQLAVEEQVRIFYACESGSRAWGFPSADSDYDVRFLYLHPKDWYLTIDVERRRDVIERPVRDLIDINGWDLRKALKLMRGGNPPLMEWLGSPIIYLEKYTIAARMRELLARYYTPVACWYHYLHMAQGNYRDYLKGSTVWIKKYFYVLRPLLAIRWIEQARGVVPTEFQILLNTVVDSPELRQEISQLLAAKQRGDELDRGPRITVISQFIETELARLENKKFEAEIHIPTTPIKEFNELFRAAIAEVWGE